LRLRKHKNLLNSRNIHFQEVSCFYILQFTIHGLKWEVPCNDENYHQYTVIKKINTSGVVLKLAVG